MAVKEKVKEAIRQKKVANKKMCKNRSKKNKARYENMKHSTTKTVANSMPKEPEKELTNLSQKRNSCFQQMKFVKNYEKDIEGRRMRGKRKDGKLGSSEDGKT